jgi:3D-(3,5/4)-trihydroxycyclohexane-1,2-dione acylhydrolase (decyclizing)
VTTIEEFEAALRDAAASPRTTVVQVETDPLVQAPSSEAWWDIPVAKVADVESTRAARSDYEQHKRAQRQYLSPSERVEIPR